MMGRGTTEAELKKKAPSYVQPMHFASALIDVLDTGRPTISTSTPSAPRLLGEMAAGDLASITTAINYVVPNPKGTNPQINAMLLSIANRTGGNIDLSGGPESRDHGSGFVR
jgi:hypothetical protein